MTGILPDETATARRVQRQRTPAPVSAGGTPELGDARSETRGRPADDNGLSHAEIAKRTSDDNFQDNPDLLTRTTLGESAMDGFVIPAHLKKPGWDYEWKTRTVQGEPIQTHIPALERNQGWRPVPADDMREILSPGYDKRVIESGGHIMMMRPMRLSREARNEMIGKADSQRQDKLRQAIAGPSDQDKRMPRRVLNDQFESHIEGEVGTYRPRQDAQQ